MTEIEYSDHQMDIFDAVVNTDDNIKVGAVAGSGKTTTIVACLNLLPRNVDAVFLSLNNFIVDTLKERITRKDVVISTVHSLGWRASMIQYRKKKPTMDKNKLLNLIDTYCSEKGLEKKARGYYFYIITKIVNLMKLSLAKTVEEVEELCMKHGIFVFKDEIEIAFEIFDKSIKDCKRFDFTDMIYFPATMDEIKMKKYDYVFLDESQDLSPAAHAIVKKILAPKGRLIAVGDPRQAIYGFAGADVNSYENLSNITKMIDLPLSVCYRCAENIVLEAKKIVDYIEPYPGAEKGVVKVGSLKDLRKGDWILCRNVAPLVTLCLYLLKNEVKCKIRGKDIGLAISALISKSKVRSFMELQMFFDSELKKMKSKLTSYGSWKPEEHPKYVYLSQQIEVIIALSEGLTSIAQIHKRIENIFSDDVKGIILSTIHKSKGLENDRILLLCPELIPSKFATKEWQRIQEDNLMYIAITRAKKELIYIPEKTFRENILFPIIV
jgi:superfamily I DNA/RNA helicase